MVEATETKTEVTPAAPTTPVVEKPAEKPPEEPKVDWEARYKERDAEFAKLTKQAEDSRSREIAQMKQAERDSLIRLTAEKVDALATAMETGEWAGYKAKVEELNQATSKAQLTAAVEVKKNEAVQELLDLRSELGFDIEQDPRFANMGLMFREGLRTGEASYFDKAVSEANKAARKIAKDETAAQAKAHAKAIKDATEKAAKEAKEAAGVFDLGAGGGAGSSNPTATDDTIDRLWTDFDRAHPGQANPYDKQYRVLLGR